MNLMVNKMGIFDDAGNLITKKPEPDKLETLKEEFETIVNGKKVFHCEFCRKEWDNNLSNRQHESWCEENPNRRTYRKNGKKGKTKTTITKIRKPPKPKPKKDIIKELNAFNKVFCLTDKQIVDYIRKKMNEA